MIFAKKENTLTWVNSGQYLFFHPLLINCVSSGHEEKTVHYTAVLKYGIHNGVISGIKEERKNKRNFLHNVKI